MPSLAHSKSLFVQFVLLTSFLFIAVACGDAEGSFGEFAHEPGDPGSDTRQVSDPDRPDIGARSTPDPRSEGNRLHDIWPQVWSQHAPGIKSWEYKVNCGQANSHTDPCFLSDLTAVNVETPEGSVTVLDFDFNTNAYSGEVTRRWVKYGPPEGSLPEQGDYIFRYWRGDELAFEQAVPYRSEPVSFPTEVQWRRVGDDLFVDWSPPQEADSSMSYKVIIWQTDDSPPITVSKQLDWDATSGVLEDVPLREGGSYSLNVALYFSDGYAYSEYALFDWPSE